MEEVATSRRTQAARKDEEGDTPRSLLGGRPPGPHLDLGSEIHVSPLIPRPVR